MGSKLNSNELAVIRTRLAINRTLMAAFRTSLALVGLSIVLFKAFKSRVYTYLGVLSVISAVIVIVVALVYYKRLSEQLKD